MLLRISHTACHFSLFLSFLLLVATITTASDNDLFTATRNDDPIEMKQVLEDGSANIEAIGPGGQTPLLFAILSGRAKAAQFLVQQGADVTATEKDGYNVLHAAGFQGRHEILTMLLNHPTVQEMVNVKKTGPHQDGFYPIHRACWGREQRHTDTVRVFVEKASVDINLKAGNGKTCADMTKNPATLALIEELNNKKASGEGGEQQEEEL